MLVLVVDDAEELRGLMTQMLELLGHQVLLAADGQQALDVAGKRSPDVILMDLGMPVMDGITATQILRVRLDTSRVPIIAVSAYLADQKWRDKAIAAGCNGCLAKPFEIDELERMLAPFSPGGHGAV